MILSSLQVAMSLATGLIYIFEKAVDLNVDSF
jgi:hypothetical protein